MTIIKFFGHNYNFSSEDRSEPIMPPAYQVRLFPACEIPLGPSWQTLYQTGRSRGVVAPPPPPTFQVEGAESLHLASEYKASQIQLKCCLGISECTLKISLFSGESMPPNSPRLNRRHWPSLLSFCLPTPLFMDR